MQRPLVWAAWVVLLWGVREAKPFLVPMLLAALLAFLIAPLANKLRERNLQEWAAVTVSSLLLLLPAIALVALVIGESRILIRDYPKILEAIRTDWTHMLASPWVERFGLSAFLDTSSLGERLSEEAGKGLGLLISGLKAFAEAGAHGLLILFFAVLMLASRGRIRKSAAELAGSTRNLATLKEIVKLIEQFLVARIGIAVGVAILDFIVLRAFGIPYSVILACLLGGATFVPLVGFFLAALPPLILSFTSGHSGLETALMLALVYGVASAESHFVAPKILGKQLNLNLLSTFLALFAGELLWGIWGMILSVPLLGIVRITLYASKEGKPWATLLSDRESGAK